MAGPDTLLFEPGEPAPLGFTVSADSSSAVLIGLTAEAAMATVEAYFATFAWDATLDPTTMSAASFLGAAFAGHPAPA